MRLISLEILIPSSVDIDGVLIPTIQQHFTHYLPSHRMFETDDLSNVLVIWDKISISDNFDMNAKAREIERSVTSPNVIVIELGDEPTFLKTWTPTIIGSIVGIAGIVTSVIIYFVSKTAF